MPSRVSVLLVSIALIFSSAASAQTAKIAVAVSLTGAGEPFGGPAVEGARLAVEEANATGEAPRLELEIRDDASNADRAREVAGQVLASDALVVVGPATTPMALAVGPVFADGGIVCIGTTTTGDTVTNAATFFRAIFKTSDVGEALANYLRYILGGTRAIVLLKNDGYGQPVAAGFKRAAERLGIATEYRPYDTVAQAQEEARRAALDPDKPAIVLAMLNEGVPTLTALRRAGARGTILGTNTIAGEFFSAAFANEPEEQRQHGFFTEGVYAANSFILDSANAETLAFVDRFHSRFGHDPSAVSIQGYEGARLAVAAVRATADKGNDMHARRQSIGTYLASLDGPAHAVAGLTGPLWFTPDRGRLQPLRLGRYHDGMFESAPGQLVPVRTPDQAEIASGEVVEIAPGRFARRQQVVYTGAFINEIPRVDIAQSTFTADFYLWQRFVNAPGAGVADPSDIDFPDLVRGNFDPKRPAAQGTLDDGTTYRLWRVRGDFKNDFDLHRYPYDRQTLRIRFFNARVASDRVVYVQDRRSIVAGTDVFAPVAEASPKGGGGSAFAAPTIPPTSEAGPAAQPGGTADLEAFRNLTQWRPERTAQLRDILVTQSALGDPRLVGVERVRELSGYRVEVQVQRRTLATLTKSLLPLGIMTLIMLASLYFPHALVKEKVTVTITAALSGAVLLAAVNSQLGAVGYTMAVEYVFYVFFALCLMCIVSVLTAERLRVAGHATIAVRTETVTKLLYVAVIVVTIGVALVVTSQW
jgi:branched-chain amino acid transport system substrate-binding protein